jgi:hypothetical protein
MSGIKKHSGATVDVRILPERLTCHYKSEADLRSGIARIADAYGWFVEQEVVVPGWGRIDLVLRYDAGVKPFLVELKVALEKPSDVRKGFQQADGYSRWWAKEIGEPNVPVLSAVKHSSQLVAAVGDAYPTVAYRNCHSLLTGLRTWSATPTRIARAAERRARRQHDLDINDRAYELLLKDSAESEAKTAEAATVAAAQAGEGATSDE